MEVKDVFELRKQGRIEEAYAAILPMYAAHKGHYTSLAMFWVAADVMFLRFKERKLEEAYKIFRSLLRLYPAIEVGDDGSAQRALLRASLLVADYHPAFSMLHFIETWGIERLKDEDWRLGQADGHPVPALAMRILARIFKELKADATPERALRVAPILAEALKHAPYNKDNQRYKAIIYGIMGKRDKAVYVYRHLIRKHHQASLYQELAELIDEPKVKIALLCRALIAQRDEKFRQKLRYQLAELLFQYDKSRAKYELERCIATRKQLGYAITYAMQNLVSTLAEVQPVSDIDQKAFYRKMEAYVATLEL